MASLVGAHRARSRSSSRTKTLSRLAIPATVAAFVLLTACGQGDDPPASATPAATEGTPVTCSPAGDEIALVAERSAFDKDCLAAAANQPFTIRLENRDSFATTSRSTASRRVARRCCSTVRCSSGQRRGHSTWTLCRPGRTTSIAKRTRAWAAPSSSSRTTGRDSGVAAQSRSRRAGA